MDTSRQFSGDELETALKDGTLVEGADFIVGMVKASGKDGHIDFTNMGCETWVQIATKLIEKAERLGTSQCRDHVHPVFAITLVKPKDAVGKLALSLLSQSTTSRPRQSTPNRPRYVPTAAVSRAPGYSLGIGRGSMGFLDPFDRCNQECTDIWANCIGLGYADSRCDVVFNECYRRCSNGLPY